MYELPMLNDGEMQIVTGLLERERDDLHGEIHHTDSSDLRQELHEKLTAINGLLEKLAKVPVH